MPQLSDSTGAARVLLLIIWASINVSTYINPRFVHVVSSLARLSTLFDLAGFTFCPGLYDTICAAAPPNLVWVESLPVTVSKNVWGVYILVLKKHGCPPLVYIGSGTAVNRGVRARLSEHERGILCPRLVHDARDKGYEITHMALLAHCPIPAPADTPTLRTIIVAMEAVFSCVFWSMHSRDASYGFAHLCPWPRNSFEWAGLCSHCPLVESIRPGEADLDFTPEQLEEMDAAIKEKNRLYQVQYQKTLRANPTPQFRARQKRNNIKQVPGTRLRQQAAVSSKKYHCPACNVSCRDHASLLRHNKTPRHAKKTQMGDDDFHCTPCNLSFRYLSAFNQHKKSKGHIAKTSC